MIIGIQMDNGLSSMFEIDEALLDSAADPVVFALEQTTPLLTQLVERRRETRPAGA